MVKPSEVSKGPPAYMGRMQQCSKPIPKIEAELSTIKDESLLKVVSNILDQDEPEEESDEDVDDLQLSSSMHNHSGTIGQPLDARPIVLPCLLTKTLSELSPNKETKLTKPHQFAKKRGMLYHKS